MFRPHLARAVMDGQKTVTRRAVSDNPRSPWSREGCALRVGRSYAVQPGRGKPAIGRARVVSVRRETFDPLAVTPEEARREGFPDGTTFRLTWAATNRSVEPVEVWRIELEPVERTTP